MPEVRPIDANKAVSELRTLPEQERLEYMGVYDLLKSMPTLDYEPVVHAHWIEDDDCQVCSNCGEEHCWAEYRASYCEDCGAKMDEEMDEEVKG